MQTEIEKLGQLIKSLLFVSGQGIEINDIAEKLEIDKKEVLKAIEFLKEKHSDDGINIITFKNSVQMCSNPKFAEDIATVLNPIKEKQLTKATLETVAIVAYKQPVTRIEIEQIRGVNSDYALQVLLNFKMIEVIGRKDAIGKPLLFATTNEFLKRFELQNIEDLPDYDELVERIKLIHSDQKTSEGLFGSFEIIPEEELKEKEQQVFSNNESLTELIKEKSEQVIKKVKEGKLFQNQDSSNDIIDNDNFGLDILA